MITVVPAVVTVRHNVRRVAVGGLWEGVGVGSA